MARTILASETKEVVIGFDQPFAMIGERINPTGRKLFSKELKDNNYWRVKKEALAQVEAGAQILDVNVGVPLADEAQIMSEVIPLIQGLTDAPLCIDSSIMDALEAGLWSPFLMTIPEYQKIQMSDLKLLNGSSTARPIMELNPKMSWLTHLLCLSEFQRSEHRMF